MGKLDELSKKLNQEVEIENNNRNQKLIKEEWIQILVEVAGLEIGRS